MRLLNTCAIVNWLLDGWKGMGNGGSRSRSRLNPILTGDRGYDQRGGMEVKESGKGCLKNKPWGSVWPE